jgi:hypothetical protein
VAKNPCFVGILGFTVLIAFGCVARGKHYIVTERPLAVASRPLLPVCIALDLADPQGVWWWEGGTDCSTSKNHPGIIRGDRGTVLSHGTITTATFQIPLIGDEQRGDPMFQPVSVALSNGRMHSMATGADEGTLMRADLRIPSPFGH